MESPTTIRTSDRSEIHTTPLEYPADRAAVRASPSLRIWFFLLWAPTLVGQIRIPASYCGCVGLKPTYGFVSRAGVFPLGLSLDHVGPLTCTVRDAALVMNVIAASHPGNPPSGRRIGVPEKFFNERLAPEVAAAYEQTLRTAETIGFRLVPITVPDPSEINTIGRVILLCEASAVLKPWLDRRDDFGADVLALLDQGLLVSATDYIDARRLRRLYRKRWAELWDRVDVVLTPTTPIQAPPIGSGKVGDEDVRLVSTRFVRPFNVLGIPALSIPVRTSSLPVGIQVIGQPFEEGAIFEIAGLLEHAINP